MNSLLQKFGLTLDDILRSTLTLLVFLALLGLALWYFLRAKVHAAFFFGFGAGALYLLWVNAKNGVQDKTFNPASADTFNEAMAGVDLKTGSAVGAGVKPGSMTQWALDYANS